MAYEQNRFRVVLKQIRYIMQTIFICRGASNRTKEIDRLPVKTNNTGVIEKTISKSKKEILLQDTQPHIAISLPPQLSLTGAFSIHLRQPSWPEYDSTYYFSMIFSFSQTRKLKWWSV